MVCLERGSHARVLRVPRRLQATHQYAQLPVSFLELRADLRNSGVYVQNAFKYLSIIHKR